MLSADLFLFVFGMSLVYWKDIRNDQNFYGNQIHKDSAYTFIAVISDLPVEKEKFVKCALSIHSIKTSVNFTVVSGNSIAYFKKSNLVKSLKAGQTLLIHSRFLEIEPPKNPFEFNYKQYLQYKQFNHSLFVDSNSYQVIEGINPLNGIWSFGLRCKTFVLQSLKNSSLSQQSYAICAALLTGYDDEIDKTVMDAFAHSGTLHVLSVSGLHTGLIYLILNFLFDLIDKKRKYKLSRFIVITLLLWLFALLTGFSAPVLRAVIMFNLLGAGNLFFRNQMKNQLNILYFSAFILLCFDPYFIKDIGFLLSYFALFGLIYFQPKLAAIWQTDNKFLSYLWQSTCVSFAATISTLPITLFYFKQFPIWFFVCNIFVVPATFLLLVFAVFVLLKLNFFSVLINYLVKAMTWLILLFNHENIGYIDKIDFRQSDFIFLSGLIILISVSVEYRSYISLKISLITLICWQCISLFESIQSKHKSLLTVYQIKKKDIFSLKNTQSVYLNQLDSLSFKYSVKPQLISFNYPQIKSQTFNYISSDTESILFLKSKTLWPKIELKEVTTLVLSSNFKLSEKEIRSFSNLKRIVSDGSNNKYTSAHTEKLSRKFGLDFHNTNQLGAFIMPLQ